MEEKEEAERVRELSKAKESRDGKREINQRQQNNTRKDVLVRTKITPESMSW